LWALGRAANPEQLRKEGNIPYVGVSDIKHPSYPNDTPRPLTLTEIQEYVSLYATAASNAVHRAGFDGVEIHGANGYLVDQFIQDVTNNRTDAYGGSIDNRTRFALEVTEAVVKAVGESKTALRLSPWTRFGGMRMAEPKPTFSHLVSRLRDSFPNLAYLHLVEPRFDEDFDEARGWSNDFIRDTWGDRPLITAGGYTRETAINVAEQKGDIIAFSRLFIANVSIFCVFCR
jgi:NADPH2 dehydrogenase